MTLTPGLVAWVWDDEDMLPARARAAVAALREAKQESGSAENTANGPGEDSNPQRPSKDPWKIAIENLSRSRDPEDLEVQPADRSFSPDGEARSRSRWNRTLVFLCV